MSNPLFLESPIDRVRLYNWTYFHAEERVEAHSIISDRQVLGKRAERFFADKVKMGTRFEIMEEGVQVFDENTTLGEFDFLLKDRNSGRMIHLEMVYKFYLFDSDHPEQWIGPNRKDYIRLKMEKLTIKQFPLLYSQFGAKKLISLAINPQKIEQELLFLAKLFIPYDQSYSLGDLNPSAIQGYWFQLDAFMEYLGDDLAFIPEKQDWLQTGDEHTEWVEPRSVREELLYHLKNNRSPMVWLKRKEKVEQAFVVWWKKK